MGREELRAIIATELVERDLVDPPICKLGAQAPEVADCIAHQYDVHAQQWTASTCLSLGDQHRDDAPQVREPAAPASQVVVHCPEAVDADRQLAVVLGDVLADGRGCERCAVRGRADSDTEPPSEMFGELAEGWPEQRLAAHPAHEHTVAGGMLIVREHGTEARYRLDVSVATDTAEPAIESAERAAQVACLRDPPDDDHRGASVASP
jgi:hypothetical protein